MKGFMSAQMHYASANGGYFGTLQCLSQPADCIPGFEGPPFFDRVVHGYRLDLYPVFYRGGPGSDDSKFQAFAYVAIPQSWWLPNRAFCVESTGSITIYVRSKEKSGYNQS